MQKPKVRPGSLRHIDFTPEAMLKRQFPDGAIPPWFDNSPEARAKWEAKLKRDEKESAFTRLQRARVEAEGAIGSVRSTVFDNWVGLCVVTATRPDEWTQSRILYESYLRFAKRFGDNKLQRAHSVQAMATETMWGRMMTTQFPKTRRGSGYFYPLRLKRGA